MPASALEQTVASLCERELLETKGDNIRASALGRRFLDTLIGEFF